jgi:hypothetical protein
MKTPQILPANSVRGEDERCEGPSMIDYAINVPPHPRLDGICPKLGQTVV